jgi:hypothetical protein
VHSAESLVLLLNSALIFYPTFWQTAIPILIGTKFDDFAQLPLEMQWAIVNQVSSAFYNTVLF